MKHFYAMLIKFIGIAAILEVILGFLTAVSYLNILLIALAVTVVSYFLGDVGVLRRTNNTVATVTDFGLALVLILMFDAFLGTADITFFDAAFASLAIAAGEWIFHRFAAPALLFARR